MQPGASLSSLYPSSAVGTGHLWAFKWPCYGSHVKHLAVWTLCACRIDCMHSKGRMRVSGYNVKVVLCRQPGDFDLNGIKCLSPDLTPYINSMDNAECGI